jgi:hypothetical protein
MICPIKDRLAGHLLRGHPPNCILSVTEGLSLSSAERWAPPVCRSQRNVEIFTAIDFLINPFLALQFFFCYSILTV